jgi:hygromycin-B 4-O-kinase
MQVHHKPKLDKATLSTFLEKEWLQPLTKLEKLVEGEDSQTLYFESGGKCYVLRINKSDFGFKKDAYAYEHFASKTIPIPKVLHIGKVDDEHAYCISNFIEGPTLQDLDRNAVEILLPATLEMQRVIADVDIRQTSGYGEFDLSGSGKSASWQEWLVTPISSAHFDWDAIVSKGRIERSFLDKVFTMFRRLVEQVPNERRLIHGDFGSNNVLTRDNQIVAVLDWDAASYGDWLFDVAGAYYWRNHLLCMELAADYYERELNHLPHYQEPINCYQLRAALIEMYVQANRGEREKLNQHTKRCRELLDMMLTS